jgi:myo-inositol-1(or 4)-monophosphatase
MTAIDVHACTSILRRVTDEVAEKIERPRAESTIQDILLQIQTLNGWANSRMRTALHALYPEIGWSDAAEANAEAQTLPQTQAPFWIFDPIDAAYHAVQGLPLWSSSLALISGATTIFAAVYEPNLNEMFVASKGAGAMMNGATIRPVGKSLLRSAVVATFLPPWGHGGPERHDKAVALISEVSKKVFLVRQMASASLHLAYVAAGRLDALFEAGSTTHDWLAGALLVEEAGLRITDLGGRPFEWGADGIVACSKNLSQPLLSAIRTGLDGSPHT